MPPFESDAATGHPDEGQRRGRWHVVVQNRDLRRAKEWLGGIRLTGEDRQDHRFRRLVFRVLEGRQRHRRFGRARGNRHAVGCRKEVVRVLRGSPLRELHGQVALQPFHPDAREGEGRPGSPLRGRARCLDANPAAVAVGDPQRLTCRLRGLVARSRLQDQFDRLGRLELEVADELHPHRPRRLADAERDRGVRRAGGHDVVRAELRVALERVVHRQRLRQVAGPLQRELAGAGPVLVAPLETARRGVDPDGGAVRHRERLVVGQEQWKFRRPVAAPRGTEVDDHVLDPLADPVVDGDQVDERRRLPAIERDGPVDQTRDGVVDSDRRRAAEGRGERPVPADVAGSDDGEPHRRAGLRAVRPRIHLERGRRRRDRGIRREGRGTTAGQLAAAILPGSGGQADVAGRPG